VLVERLGRPDRVFRSVHVAGTNGKGSVVAMVEAALRAAGFHSARYTSPHLIDLSERFVVDGRPVAAAALEVVAADVRGLVETLLDEGTLNAPPTFFEVTTAIAFELFRRERVEIAVCEVGLGGRLDATNVLEPVVTAVTTIGFDHQQYLGDSLAAIAREKAGIVKPGIPVVVGRLGPEALEAVRAVAAERGAPFVRAHDGVDLSEYSDRDPPDVVLRTTRCDYGRLVPALKGRHQLDNVIVAVAILEALDRTGIHVPTDAVRAGIEQVWWPGRLDTRRLPDGREVLLDAAHNADGAIALRDALALHAPRPIVFAAMRDKDVVSMLRALAAITDTFIMTRASNRRSHDPAALAEWARRSCPGCTVLIEPSIGSALRTAWALSPRIVVAGSIFLLGDAISELNRS
jgi:dihydrofolate synthase/folylpolyglutamate synthase